MRMDLTKEELGILTHALGITYCTAKSYRRHFYHLRSRADLLRLVEMGLMVTAETIWGDPSSDYVYFIVTKLGEKETRTALREQARMRKNVQSN